MDPWGSPALIFSQDKCWLFKLFFVSGRLKNQSKETTCHSKNQMGMSFNWERAFSNTNVNEKVCIFNKSALYVLSNFLPHETILCDDKDLPWFNSRIKSLVQDKNKIFKNYRKKKTNLPLLNKLTFLQEHLNGLKTISKNIKNIWQTS